MEGTGNILNGRQDISLGITACGRARCQVNGYRSGGIAVIGPVPAFAAVECIRAETAFETIIPGIAHQGIVKYRSFQVLHGNKAVSFGIAARGRTRCQVDAHPG